MSRFQKLSQTLWHCQCHIVWCLQYRFRVLEGEIKKEVEGYCVDTVDLDAEMIRKYVKYPEQQEKKADKLLY